MLLNVDPLLQFSVFLDFFPEDFNGKVHVKKNQSHETEFINNISGISWGQRQKLFARFSFIFGSGNFDRPHDDFELDMIRISEN